MYMHQISENFKLKTLPSVEGRGGWLALALKGGGSSEKFGISVVVVKGSRSWLPSALRERWCRAVDAGVEGCRRQLQLQSCWRFLLDERNMNWTGPMYRIGRFVTFLQTGKKRKFDPAVYRSDRTRFLKILLFTY